MHADVEASADAAAVIVRVREPHVARLLDANGMLAFDARRTIASRVVGFERAKTLANAATGGLGRFAAFGSVVVVCVVVLFLGLARTVREEVMWAAVGVMVAWTAFVLMVAFDADVCWCILMTETAISKLVLIAVAAWVVTQIFCCDDSRGAAYAVAIVAGNLVQPFSESIPYAMHGVTTLLQFNGFVLHAVELLLLNFGFYPDVRPAPIALATLTVNNQTHVLMEAYSVFNTFVFALGALNLSQFVAFVRTRNLGREAKHGLLLSVSIHVPGSDVVTYGDYAYLEKLGL